MKVIPTVFSAGKKEFKKRFEAIKKVAKEVQIDFMDGKFVEGKSISVKDVPSLRKYKIKFEAHLMCKKPETYLAELKKKGFCKIIFHEEVFHTREEVFDFIKKARKKKLKVFIAINPKTQVWDVLPFLHSVDGVLIMGVNPGKEHQEFIPEVYKKIHDLKEFNKKTVIEVDGGINFGVAEKLKFVGADIVNSGSMVAEAHNPKEIIEQLENI